MKGPLIYLYEYNKGNPTPKKQKVPGSDSRVSSQNPYHQLVRINGIDNQNECFFVLATKTEIHEPRRRKQTLP